MISTGSGLSWILRCAIIWQSYIIPSGQSPRRPWREPSAFWFQPVNTYRSQQSGQWFVYEVHFIYQWSIQSKWCICFFNIGHRGKQSKFVRNSAIFFWVPLHEGNLLYAICWPRMMSNYWLLTAVNFCQILSGREQLFQPWMTTKRCERSRYLPTVFTDIMWELLVDCWHQDPGKRPDMGDVVQRLREMWLTFRSSPPCMLFSETCSVSAVYSRIPITWMTSFANMYVQSD